MKKSHLAIPLLVILTLQLLSLPLGMGWFYAQRQDIAANRCINRFEPTLMCGGQCVLQEIVLASLDGSTEEEAPAPSRELRLPLLLTTLCPSIFNPGVAVDRSAKMLPAKNFAYNLLSGAPHRSGVFHPPAV